MSDRIRLAWFILALAALVMVAHMTRYVPVEDAEGGAVWDRWLHRYCYEQADGSIECGAPPDETVTPGIQS